MGIKKPKGSIWIGQHFGWTPPSVESAAEKNLMVGGGVEKHLGERNKQVRFLPWGKIWMGEETDRYIGCINHVPDS